MASRTRVAAITVAFLVFVTGAGASSAPLPLGFPDGVWDGTMSFSTLFDFAETGGFAGGTGTFDLTVTGGSIVDGGFTLNGKGIAINAQPQDPVAGAVLSVTVAGTVTGTAEIPTFDATSAEFSGVAKTTYGDMPVSFSAGDADIQDVQIVLLSASCEVVVGDWIHHLPETVASAGGTVSGLRGSWVATRLIPGETVDVELGAAIAELVEEWAAQSVQLTGTPTVFSADSFEELMRRATQLALSIQRYAECGGANPGVFQSVLAGAIEKMLGTFAEAAAGGLPWTPMQILRAVSMGFYGGVIGVGSPCPCAAELEGQLVAVVAGAIQDASTSGSANDLYLLGIAAQMLGASDLVDFAHAAWLAAGGTGEFPGKS